MGFDLTNLAPREGELYYLPEFYAKDKADACFEQLFRTINWQQERLFIFGRWVLVPRLMAWYGDSDATYRYSGVDHQATPWLPLLSELRIELQSYCQHRFNSVLANLYRNGQDSMGCHADNEQELGSTPLIASLSFGDCRLLRFKHCQSGQKHEIELKHGDLLIMAGKLQAYWKHELPKTRIPKQPRINLTFRQIILKR